MLSVMKCHKCGRIFAYYGERKNPHCPNTKCHTMVTKNEKTVIPVWYYHANPEKVIAGSRANKAYIYIRVFNNEISLAADVYSTDGNIFITIPLNIDKLKITMETMRQNVSVCTKNRETLVSGKYHPLFGLRSDIQNQVAVLPK